MISFHPARFRMSATPLLITFMIAMPGCASDDIDNSTPAATYEGYRSAVHNGRWETVYHLLMPEVQEKIAGTLDLNRRTIRLIMDNVPAALRANYLNEIGSPAIRDATTPASYFAATLPPARKIPSSIGRTVSTRRSGLREIPKGSKKWVVRTLGGERISIHGGTDGLYYVVPDNIDATKINQELKNAGDRLAIQKQIADHLARAVVTQP